MRGTSSERRAGACARPAAAVAALALVLSLAFAGSAAAVIVEPLPGKTLSYQPLRSAPGTLAFDKAFSNLDYNGGPVMTSNTNYTVYWDPSGGAAYPETYRSGVNRYLEDLAHDSGGHGNVDSVSAQYNDAAGGFADYESHFGGELLDTDPYPANGCTRAATCLTDAQLRAELVKLVTAHGLPTDLAHEYFLLTPPGVESCFEAAGRECSAGSSKPVYCAYHGNVPVGEGGELIYADDPYVTRNAGCDDGNHPNGPSDGALEGGLSHEHNESITDPEPNDAWTDVGGSGGEIGDKCEGEMGEPLGVSGGAKYNQVIDGHFYWYQEEWSNQGHECLQRLSFAGEEPTATFTSAPAGGEKVEFDATGSTAPGGVSRYNWQFNDGPGLSTPVETTTPTVSHTFPEGGSYVVALTVLASDGTSIGTARTIEVGSPAVPVVTKIAPKKGEAAGGASVTITGTGFKGATQVHFGANLASNVEVLSATTIVAVAPAGTAGAADVTVTTPAGTSATSAADVFKYGKPTVTAVSPSSGSLAGGQRVTITGTGFALGAATTFTFGKGKATAVECASTTSCTATTPSAAKAGVVDVVADAAGQRSKKRRPGDEYAYS